MKEKIFVILLIVSLLSYATPISSAQIKSKDNINDLKASRSEGSAHIERRCFIYGEIQGPFRCFRIPGLLYIIESENGGELFVDCGDCSLHEQGTYFKITIIGFLGLFFQPIHIGKNIFNRKFVGHANMVSFEIE